MTKKNTGESPTPEPVPAIPEGRQQGGGGVYVDGKRVAGTEEAPAQPDPQRVKERKARRAVKEAGNG